MLSRLLFLSCVATFAACGGSSSTEVTFTTIDQSVSSGVSTAQFAVVRDAAAWSALWAEHTSTSMPAPPVPQVDFAHNMVLGVFLGQRPNGCYSVAIIRVTRDNASTIAEYRETVPSSSAICAAVITRPSHLVSVPAASGPVEFVRKE